MRSDWFEIHWSVLRVAMSGLQIRGVGNEGAVLGLEIE